MPRATLTAPLITILSGGVCVAGEITPVVVEGDAVPGVGLVETIDNVAINNTGTWIVEVNTSFANIDQDSVLLRDGVLYLREGFGGLSAPPGAIIDSFDSVTLSNGGDGGFNFFIDPFPSGEDSGVYLNTDLLIQEGSVATAPQFTAGTPYLGFFDVKINDSDELMIIASIDDVAIPSSVDRAIVITNTQTHVQTVLAKEGDVLPGQVETVADFGTGPHQSAFNDLGDVLYFADLTGSTAADGVVYLNSTLLAQEGSASPVTGRDYELLSSRGLDVNNLGGYVFKANLTGDTSTDEVLVSNGAVFMQEGDSPTAIGGFSLTGFGTGSGPVQIDDAGNILWFGDWNDPNTDIDSGLFLNDELLVQEGVTMIDGLLVDTISSSQDAFFLSDNGAWAIFEATLVGGINGAFRIELVDCPADLTSDGTVNVMDLLDMLTAWGPNPGHPADLNGDGVVNVMDLLDMLTAWGPC